MIGRDAMAKQMMQRVDVADLDVVKALAAGLAEIERAQAAALEDLADAEGYDVDVQTPDPEEREALLLRGVDAATSGEAVAWWLKERHGHRLDDPKGAVEYAKMDAEAFEDQIGDWAAFYRDRGYGDAYTDWDLAEMHLQQTQGVGVEWFREAVVGLDAGAVIRELLAGNLEAVEYGIRDAAEQAREGTDDTSE
jgi:hypothetical protein